MSLAGSILERDSNPLPDRPEHDCDLFGLEAAGKPPDLRAIRVVRGLRVSSERASSRHPYCMQKTP
jgi:hypothetical protein